MNPQASDKLWSFVSHVNFDDSEVVLTGIFHKQGKKKQKEVKIIAFNDHLLLYKKKDDPKPSRSLKLEFDTKFEIIRTKVEKKSDDDDRLGEIIGLKLLHENAKQIYSLMASPEQIKEWRNFLSQRINQLNFHEMFRVFKKIGKGNFACVYLAERIEDGVEVAVKAFSKSVAYGEENGKEAIVNEISLMRKLNHKNIMKLHEVYETTNSLYMSLELLEGGSLYDQLKSKVILSNKQIQTIMFGILSGLKHMHEKDIMHRDLKLENLVFKRPNNLESIMIADFGLATKVTEKVYLYCRCGTPGYVAPEVINIKDMTTTYSSVCDVYSAGLVFHLLLTGKAAFSGKSYNTVVKMNREANIDFKSKIFDIVPKNAVELLKKMLEKDPTKRITSSQCLDNSFFDTLKPKIEEYDYIDEGDDSTDLGLRMSKINEEASKFDMMRINQLQNSPIQSPALNPTNRLKNIKDIDPENFMVMRTPVITGRQASVEGKDSPVGDLRSPGLKQVPSRFKQSNGSPTRSQIQGGVKTIQAENALYKYALKKSTQQQMNESQKEETKQQAVKNVKTNLSQNI